MIREGEGEIRGREAIQAAVAALDNPAVSLTWEPTRAEISAGGDLGWTTGTYVSRATAPDGSETESTGWYVSIWRLQGDGSWKVVMDLGNPRERPEG
jgi:ketosteroid isomerase-like protein